MKKLDKISNWLLLAILTKMEVLNGMLVWAITSLNRKGRL